MKKMQQDSTNWSISDVLQKSFELVKQNKLLWIFGMAAGGGLSLNSFRSSINSNNLQQLLNVHNNTQTVNNLPTVLGASTNQLINTFQQIFSSIPLSLYLIIGGEIGVMIIISLIISIIYSSWARGMLLTGIQFALLGNKPSIATSSERSLGVLKSLIWLTIIPSLIYLLASFGSLFLILIGYSVVHSPFTLVFIPIILIWLGAVIYWGIYLVLSLIWSQREVVIEGKKGKDAFFSGYTIAKHKFWQMILLWFVTTILTGLAIIPLIIVCAIIIGILILLLNISPIFTLLIPFVMFLVIAALLLYQGTATSFYETVWTVTYNAVRGKYE